MYNMVIEKDPNMYICIYNMYIWPLFMISIVCVSRARALACRSLGLYSDFLGKNTICTLH